MIEMTRIDGIILGMAISIPATICLVLMVIEDIREYFRHCKERQSRR